MRVLGETEQFFEIPMLYNNGELLVLQQCLHNTLIPNNKAYCFYKEYALFFSENLEVAYHFNRRQKSVLAISKGNAINRHKNAKRREEEAQQVFEETGRKESLQNNAAWRAYWEFTKLHLSHQDF
jgi:hypothetical protein